MVKRIFGFFIVFVAIFAFVIPAFAEEDDDDDEGSAAEEVSIEGTLVSDKWSEDGEDYEMLFIQTGDDVIYELDEESFDKARKFVGKNVVIKGTAYSSGGDYDLTVESIKEKR